VTLKFVQQSPLTWWIFVSSFIEIPPSFPAKFRDAASREIGVNKQRPVVRAADLYTDRLRRPWILRWWRQKSCSIHRRSRGCSGCRCIPLGEK